MGMATTRWEHGRIIAIEGGVRRTEYVEGSQCSSCVGVGAHTNLLRYPICSCGSGIILRLSPWESTPRTSDWDLARTNVIYQFATNLNSTTPNINSIRKPHAETQIELSPWAHVEDESQGEEGNEGRETVVGEADSRILPFRTLDALTTNFLNSSKTRFSPLPSVLLRPTEPPTLAPSPSFGY